MNNTTQMTGAQATWFVGASFGGTEDQLPRFRVAGIWESGYEAKPLDVYVGGYQSFTEAYGERFATPGILTDRVAASDLGLKTGGGFTGMDPAHAKDIVRYRNRAYSMLTKLKAELGPVPGTSSEGQAPA